MDSIESGKKMLWKTLVLEFKKNDINISLFSLCFSSHFLIYVNLSKLKSSFQTYVSEQYTWKLNTILSFNKKVNGARTKMTSWNLNFCRSLQLLPKNFWKRKFSCLTTSISFRSWYLKCLGKSFKVREEDLINHFHLPYFVYVFFWCLVTYLRY